MPAAACAGAFAKESCAAGPATVDAPNVVEPPLVLALTTSPPASVPSVSLVEACPDASVVVVTGETVPVPARTAKVTVTWGTGFPEVSFTRTTSGAGSVVPTVPDWLFPDETVTEAMAPADAVAVKTTGAAPPVLAFTVFVPAAGPSVHVVVAWPEELVVAVGTETVPPPPSTENVTLAPATGLPAWSSTVAQRGAARVVPTAPVWPFPEVSSSVVDVPERVVSEKIAVMFSAVAATVLVPVPGPSVSEVVASP
jgi:hypothetical protein